MNAIGSAIALIATIVSGLALMLTWSGSESVYFDREPMQGDLSAYDLSQLRNPEPMEVASVEEEGMEEEEEDKPISTAGVSPEMAEAVAAAMAQPGNGKRNERKNNRKQRPNSPAPAMAQAPVAAIPVARETGCSGSASQVSGETTWKRPRPPSSRKWPAREAPPPP